MTCPNVPIQEAIDVIRDMLQKDEALDERMVLLTDRIGELLEICLRSTYFSYLGDFYEQVDGAAMGSPALAVTVGHPTNSGQSCCVSGQICYLSGHK